MSLFCEECGDKLIVNNKFCERCGHPTEGTTNQLNSVSQVDNTKFKNEPNILDTLSEHARNISEKHTLKSMKSWSSWWVVPILGWVIILAILYVISGGSGVAIIFIGAGIMAIVQSFEIKKAYLEIINNKSAHDFLRAKERI